MIKNYRKYKKEKRDKQARAMAYNNSVVNLKAFESLRYYAFKLAKFEKIQKYRAIKHWSRGLKTKVVQALFLYAARRQEKKSMFL